MAMDTEESLEAMMAEGREERRKQLYRHKLPEKRTLAGMMAAMTKAELDDIRFNLNVTGASSLKKAELIERLVPAVEEFAARWLPSLLEEEYVCFKDFAEHDGFRESWARTMNALTICAASASCPAAKKGTALSGICRKRYWRFSRV